MKSKFILIVLGLSCICGEAAATGARESQEVESTLTPIQGLVDSQASLDGGSLDGFEKPADRQDSLAIRPTSWIESSPVSQTPGPSVGASLIGLNRAHWPVVTVAAEDGSTRHYPTYHHDLILHQEQATIERHGDAEAQLNQALDGAQAYPYSAPNMLEVVAQPIKFAVDTAMMPIEQVWRPLFGKATTP